MKIGKIGRTFRWMRRLSEIAHVLVRYGFADLVDRSGLSRFLPARHRVLEGEAVSKEERTAARFRRALEELGPTFVKLGQMLATRPDVMPAEYIDELRALQESVEPLPFAVVIEQIEKVVSKPWKEVYEEIDAQPLAAGSIAQVHRCKLRSGERGVLKVQRPGIAAVFRADVEVLRKVAGLIEDHVEEARPYRPREVVEEFAHSLEREFDFLEEATVIETFRDFFADGESVKIPAVFWEATGGILITMEEVRGRSLSEFMAAEERPSKETAERVLRAFLRQYFEAGVFHADPHPGNIRILEDGRVGLIDFGSVGMLTTEMLTDLAVLMSAVSGNKQSLAVAVLEEILDPREGRFPEALKSDIARLIRRYRGLPAGRISPEELIKAIVDLARRYHLYLPVELVMLARSMTLLFGALKTLAPELNLVKETEPYAGKAVARVVGPGRLVETAQTAAYRSARLLGDLPRAGRAVVRRLEDGRFSLALRHEGVDNLTQELDRASNRLAFSVVVAAIIVASSLIIAAGIGPKWAFLTPLGLGNVSVLGLLGFLFAGVLGLGLAWAIFRSGKLWR